MTGSAERMRHGWSSKCAHVRRRAFSHVQRLGVAYLNGPQWEKRSF